MGRIVDAALKAMSVSINPFSKSFGMNTYKFLIEPREFVKILIISPKGS